MALSYGALHGKSPPCQVWLWCGSGGMFFVVKRAGFQMALLKSAITIICITTLLLSAITWFESKQCHARKSDVGHRQLKQKEIQEKNTNNFCQSIGKQRGKEKREKTQATTKLFALHASAKNFTETKPTIQNVLKLWRMYSLQKLESFIILRL